jgi:hypothetical protein
MILPASSILPPWQSIICSGLVTFCSNAAEQVTSLKVEPGS